MHPSAASKLTGLWRSRYWYFNEPIGEQISAHKVRIRNQGDLLVVESVPEEGNNSYLFARLMLNDDRIATGSWEESTDPNGQFKGLVYYGALQVAVSEDKQSMSGKWVCFGRNQEVNTGKWKLDRL